MTVNLIGGEMLLWSDLDGRHGPAPAGGDTLRPLLAGVTGRTLVAGPHAPELIDAVPAEQITVLVRGIADAEALQARYASRPGVTICCGSLEKLAATPAYDSVVALDGLDRLRSAEAADLGWDDTLAQLLAVLRPKGRLLLAVENLFGLHRLLALPPAPADTEWTVSGDGDPSRPANLSRLRDRLAAAGVPVTREYAAYPAPGTPSVLLGAEVLTDPALRGYLEATLTAACRAGDVLADPARLAIGALRHGLAADLAPAWILLAGRASASPVAPAALVDGAGLRQTPEGGWLRGESTPVPLGRTQADLLLAACQRRAMPAVRELLTAWQQSPAAGVPADRVVVDAEGRCHSLAPAGRPLVALRAFAAILIGGGYAHLWPSPSDEAELTALLAGMTGQEIDPARIPAADPAHPRPDAGTVRELTMARERLERELAEAQAKHEFYERTIATRDADLKRLRQMNALLSATVPGQAANTVIGGLRAGKRAVRAVVRRTKD
jgi:hypothetical protein